MKKKKKSAVVADSRVPGAVALQISMNDSEKKRYVCKGF
jgi:hypothetical protein